MKNKTRKSNNIWLNLIVTSTTKFIQTHTHAFRHSVPCYVWTIWKQHRKFPAALRYNILWINSVCDIGQCKETGVSSRRRKYTIRVTITDMPHIYHCSEINNLELLLRCSSQWKIRRTTFATERFSVNDSFKWTFWFIKIKFPFKSNEIHFVFGFHSFMLRVYGVVNFTYGLFIWF